MHSDDAQLLTLDFQEPISRSQITRYELYLTRKNNKDSMTRDIYNGNIQNFNLERKKDYYQQQIKD